MARGFDWLNGMIYGLRAVVDESTELTSTDTIRFTGAGVTATYDEGNRWISVSIPGVDASLSWTSVATVAASATSPLVIGGSQWLSAHHVRTGATPATTTGQLRVTDGAIIAAKIDGTDEVVLQTDGSTVQIGDDFGPIIERPADLENWYVQDTTGVRLVASPTAVGVNRRLFLYGGTATTATAKGHVGLDSTGRLTVWADGEEKTCLVTGDAGGTSWRVAPDAHDLGVWRMDEASGSFANTGADGALDLVPSAGWTAVDYARSGQLVTCVSPPSLDAYIASADSPSGCQPAGALTVWSWILLTRESDRYAVAIGKLHAASGWAGPYFDYALDVMPTGSYGHWRAHINIGGAVDGLKTIELGGTSGTSTSNGSSFTIGVPHLLGLTHDGTTLKAYFDGALAGSMSAVGSIGYGTGPIVRAGITPATGAGGFGLYGLLGEARVADTVRSAAYFREVYQSFMRRWP